MRVYLDDWREKPEGFDVVVRTVKEAVDLLLTGEVTHISLDYDLSQTEPDWRFNTGQRVAMFIGNFARTEKIPRLTWEIHSTMEPDMLKTMRRALERADEDWTEIENETN